MFLEGEVDWILVFGLVSAVCVVLAIVGLAAAGRALMASRNATAELERARADAAMADRRLYQILQAIPVALVQTDPTGKFTFANRAAHQLLGRRDAELLGLRFHSATWGITYPDGRPIPPDLLPNARALRGQTVKGFQHILANPGTRKKMLVSVTAMPIENEYEEVLGSIAAIVETETLTQPEPVPAAAELTRRVFHAASSPLVVIGAEGVVREANAAAAELLGIEAEALRGREFVEAFAPEDRRVEGRQTLRAAAGGAEETFAAPVSAAPGAPVVGWKPLVLEPVEGGEPGLVLLAGQMATAVAEAASNDEPAASPAEIEALKLQLESARRETADARAAAARAAQASAVALDESQRMENVGRLTGGLAHDFNALLGVLTSALDMMLRQADDPERVRRLGAAALTAGQRGEALIQRLLAFSRGESPAERAVDLGTLLRGLTPALRERAGGATALLIEAPSEPVYAAIDAVQFEGALKALVDNAVRAAGDGGRVAILLGDDDTEAPEGVGDSLRLTVIDSGPGMSPEVAARAAEPFFTTREGAAGLGLSQAYAFARNAGGALKVEGRPGEGARISIWLPRVRAAATAAA